MVAMKNKRSGTRAELTAISSSATTNSMQLDNMQWLILGSYSISTTDILLSTVNTRTHQKKSTEWAIGLK